MKIYQLTKFSILILHILLYFLVCKVKKVVYSQQIVGKIHHEQKTEDSTKDEKEIHNLSWVLQMFPSQQKRQLSCDIFLGVSQLLG